MSLQQFLLILKARWQIILTVLAVVVGTATGVSLILPKQYTATASVLVDVKSSDPIYGAIMQAQMLPGYMATQVDIATSERVARRVVRMLGFDKNPQAVAQWREAGDGQGSVDGYFAALLGKSLEVKPSRESSVIGISFTGNDPRFAAALANAFAQAYIDTSLELKVEPAKEFASWFGDRNKQLRDALEQAQTKLSDFQREKGIVATDERLDIENARLAELSSQLAQIQAMRADTASRTRQATGRMDTSPDVLQAPVVQSLRADIARGEAKLKELSGQLGQNHPQYQRAAAELEALKARLDLEMRQVASSVGTSNTVMLQREAEVRAAMDAQKKKVLELKEVRDQVAVLQRDVEAAQRAYDLVGQRLSQTSLESQSQQTNVVVLNPATEPSDPSGPKVLRNIVLAVMLGSVLGIGLALLLELANRRVRSSDDLADVLNVPVLAVIGAVVPRKRRFFGLLKVA